MVAATRSFALPRCRTRMVGRPGIKSSSAILAAPSLRAFSLPGGSLRNCRATPQPTVAYARRDERR